MTVLRVDTIAGIGQTFGPLLDGDLEFNSQNYIVLPKGSSNQQGVLRTTEDVIGVGGTYYDNLVLAMPFNEATGLRDVSSRNRNPGAYGNVSISSTISKYYGSSAKFDGSGDLISVGITSDLQFTNNIDFTIELWGYKGASATNVNFFTLGDSFYPSGLELYVGTTGTITKVYTDNATRIEADSNPSNFAWHHYAVVRESGTLKLYIDGNVQSQTYDASSNQFGSDKTVVLSLGREYYNGTYNGLDLLGHLQDFRIYKGLAKYTANFTPPERIAEIGVGFKTGALRYNTDSNKVELYDGSQWTEVQSSRPDLNGGARGVFGGGYIAPAFINTIQYITISSTGNATDFGDLLYGTGVPGACASSSRGVFLGGGSPANINNINYVTISSTGNAVDFGDLINAGRADSCASNSTRGLRLGSTQASIVNTIEYITVASTGNAQDFGDTTQGRAQTGALSSPTRAINIGGYTGANVNTIDFVTISTLGNAQDFGDCSGGVQTGTRGCSNSIRGLFGGGYQPSPYVSQIDYLTIATTGNSTDFGNLSVGSRYNASCSSPTRGIFGIGETPGGNLNNIEYVMILTQGNAVDFGDLLTGTSGYVAAATSNAHGGL
jgi:hypothetical protein